MNILFKFSAISFLCLLVVSCGGRSDKQETNVELLPLQAQDNAVLNKDESLNGIQLPMLNDNENEATYLQVLEHSQQMQSSAKLSVKSDSKEYALNVSGEELNQGVELPLSSKGAIVRIISAQGALSLKQEAFEYKIDGRWVLAKDAFDLVVDKETLSAAGLKAGADQLAFKLNTAATMNDFSIKSLKTLPVGNKYRIHVVEKNSQHVLNTSVQNVKLTSGDELEVLSVLKKNTDKLNAELINAFVMSPDGQRYEVNELEGGVGVTKVKFTTEGKTSSMPGLWELHLSVKGGNDQEIIRYEKVGFTIAPRTALLSNKIIITSEQGVLNQLSFEVDAVLDGRYEVSSVLYGHNENNELVPGMLISKAQWINGSEKLTININQDKLLESGIKAPYELRYLSLKDQSRMAELWNQERAAVF